MSRLRDRSQRVRLKVGCWEKVGVGNSEAAADGSALAASHVRGPLHGKDAVALPTKIHVRGLPYRVCKPVKRGCISGSASQRAWAKQTLERSSNVPRQRSANGRTTLKFLCM